MANESRSSDVNKQTGGVTIGDVEGGIHDAVIAGRDVNIVQIVQQKDERKRDAIAPAIPRLPHPHFSRRYPLQANFTGRLAERQMLTDWLIHGQQPILALVAIGGMGKSSLAWYWLQNDIDLTSLDGVLWWSFEEGEAAFARFLTEAIHYVSDQTVNPTDLSSTYDRVRTLTNLLQERCILLILDGFERQLQAYANLNAAYQPDDGAAQTADARACVDPHIAQLLIDIAAGPTQAKVLLTTRLMIRDLESPSGEPLHGCRKKELTSLPPTDAVTFMRDQGVTKGTDAEIIAACKPYGYHPLSLRLLSGLIRRDKRRPGDIAIAPRYQAHTSLVKCQHEILATAYDVLPEAARLLLSRLAAFRSAMPYEALLIFSEFEDEDTFNEFLEELIERGLLSFDPSQALFDLHPIVRAYAYDRLTDPTGTHAQLRDYFATIPTPDADQIHSVEDLSSVIELYHHTVKCGRFDDAWHLYDARLRRPLYYEICAYEVETQLLTSLLGVDQAPPRVQGTQAQTWVLIYLSMCYERMGQLRSALTCAEQAVSLNRAGGRPANLGSSLVALASVYSFLGQLQAAREASAEAVTIFDQMADMNWYGISHRNYGHILILCGDLAQAEQQLDLAEEIYSLRPTQFAHGLARLTMLRSDVLLARKDEAAALDMAQKAYETALAGRFKREATAALYRLGYLRHAGGHLAEAKTNLETALQDCRRMRLAELEPDVLLALARVYLALSPSDLECTQKADQYSQEALSIANRCGYLVKQATIHNFLARWKLDAGHPAEARHHAETARDRAWCDGPPNAYQSALDEAEKLLQEITEYPHEGVNDDRLSIPQY